MKRSISFLNLRILKNFKGCSFIPIAYHVCNESEESEGIEKESSYCSFMGFGHLSIKAFSFAASRYGRVKGIYIWKYKRCNVAV